MFLSDLNYNGILRKVPCSPNFEQMAYLLKKQQKKSTQYRLDAFFLQISTFTLYAIAAFTKSMHVGTGGLLSGSWDSTKL